jgi:hypothetical protein
MMLACPPAAFTHGSFVGNNGATIVSVGARNAGRRDEPDLASRAKDGKDAGSVAYYVRVLADRGSIRFTIGKDAASRRPSASGQPMLPTISS